jgi:DNA-binding MarR family transcriptional regulator
MSNDVGTNGEQFSPLFHSLFEDSRLKTTHIALYGMIWSKCSQFGGTTYVGNAHYEERLQLKSRAVTNLITHLEACGYVARWFDYEGGKKVRRYLKVLGTQQNAGREDQCAFENKSVCISKPISMHQTADNIDKLNRYNNIDKGDESPKEVIKEKAKKKDPLDVEVGTVERDFKGVKYFDYEEPTEEQCIEAMKFMGNRMNPKSVGESYWADKCNKGWTRSYGKVKIKSWPNDMWSDFKKGYIHTGEKKW